MNRHKSMKITNRNCPKRTKLFVTVHPRNVCKMVFPDHLWLPFLDQPQSDKVVFAIIYFGIYKYLVTEWKHGIYINDIVKFNGSLENL